MRHLVNYLLQFVFLDPENTGCLVYVHHKSSIVNILHCTMLVGFAIIFPIVIVWPLVLPMFKGVVSFDLSYL